MVIVILGVMAAVVVFAVSSLTGKSQAAACADDARSVTDAQERYKALEGSYGTEAQLVSKQLLRQASSLNDIELSGGSYDVVPVGACVSDLQAAGGVAPGSAVSVRLLDSNGTGLEGATIEYSDGSWSDLGTTDGSGVALGDVPAGSYEFRVDYRGQTQTIAATAVTPGSVVDIHTVPVTVSVGGAPGAAVAHLGNDGYWMTDDDTDGGGVAHLELLAGSYVFRADYNGTTDLIPGISVPGQPSVSFGIASVTVHSGGGGVGISHRGNNGTWIEDGATNGSGNVVVNVLPGSYEFRSSNNPGSPTGVGIVGNTVVNVP